MYLYLGYRRTPQINYFSPRFVLISKHAKRGNPTTFLDERGGEQQAKNKSKTFSSTQAPFVMTKHTSRESRPELQVLHLTGFDGGETSKTGLEGAVESLKLYSVNGMQLARLRGVIFSNNKWLGFWFYFLKSYHTDWYLYCWWFLQS